MLQCISPHLTIDHSEFMQFLDQYKRWLFRIRYACTYHHETVTDKIKSYIPNIPIINPGPTDLDPPKRDPPHAHTEFDFSWGTGPLVDSYTGLYYLNGSHTRVPGHEGAEIYNDQEREYQWQPLRSLGPTNEYIHPIVYHRSIVHGWDTYSPLQTNWIRENDTGPTDSKRRFWWHKTGEEKKLWLPEWAILSQAQGFNFERTWYENCEKTRKTLDMLAGNKDFGPGKDFLQTLDEKIDLDAFENLPQTHWP